MKIQVQITIQPEGQAEVVHEVARLERGPLRPDTLGLSLAEARSILAGLERTMAEGQAAQVRGPSTAVCPLRPAARVQRTPSSRVPYPFR